MISGHCEEEILQQFFDGELSDGSQTEVRQHLQTCEQCAERFRSLQRLHDLINLAAKDAGSEVDSDALFGRITRGVAGQPSASGTSSKVVSMQDWRDRVKTTGAHVWLPMAAAAALIIAVIHSMAMPDRTDEETVRTLPRRVPPMVLVNKTEKIRKGETPEAAAPNSEVSQVDFGENTGTVFEIALADGVSTPVVWINDELEDSVAP
jgi:anti-sigma factor RsiW